MEKKLRPVLVAALVFFFVLVGIQAPAVAQQVSGAIWTTDVTGTIVNDNHYATKPDVYLNGGPKGGGGGLPNGDYYIQVTNPNGGVVLGWSWNSPDPSSATIWRQVRVEGGVFRRVLQNGVIIADIPPVVQLWSFLFSAEFGFTTNGYENTPNNGGVYKVWASQNPTFPPKQSKTDNFHVEQPVPGHFYKTFLLRVPPMLVDYPEFENMQFWVHYTESPPSLPPGSRTWIHLQLAQEAGTYDFSYLVDFDHTVTIWWYFEAVDPSCPYYHWTSPERPDANGETLVPPGSLLNDEEIPEVLKNFQLTVPAILIDHPAFADVVFSAGYQFVDPLGIAPPSIWYSLDLKRVDTTDVYDGEIWFPDGIRINWKFKVSADDDSWESPIYGPETLGWPGPEGGYLNREVLKVFRLEVPAILVDHPAFQDVVFKALYFDDRTGEVLLNYATLKEGDDTYYVLIGLALFQDGETISWQFTAEGTYYSWESAIGGPETLPTDTNVNSDEIEEFTKTWKLHVAPIVPETYHFFAAWSLDSITWYPVPLTQVSPGVWTDGETKFPEGLTIYYKFYGQNSGFFWQSGVYSEGPFAAGGSKENEFWYNQPRTIGYWKNWGNHFTNPNKVKMNTIVGEVNSDTNYFSVLFYDPASGDLDYYQLITGDKGGPKAPPQYTVAWYLQEHKADTMFQMLRAQLLGLELSVAVVQRGLGPDDGSIVGVDPGATVYLSKVIGHPGFEGYDNLLINPWQGYAERTVLQIIQTVEEGTISTNWPALGWSRAKQEFAKNIIEAINQYGDGGGIGILEPPSP